MDTLEIFGKEYTNVAGFKATNDLDAILTYIRYIDGDQLGYGDSTMCMADVGLADSAVLAE